MRKSLILLAAGLLALTSLATAQTSTPSTTDRKVASRVTPVYPELAKKMHIHGIVRVEAVVKANGNVKSTRVLGGNPVLVDAALWTRSGRSGSSKPHRPETTQAVYN